VYFYGACTGTHVNLVCRLPTRQIPLLKDLLSGLFLLHCYLQTGISRDFDQFIRQEFAASLLEQLPEIRNGITRLYNYFAVYWLGEVGPEKFSFMAIKIELITP
jgi:hypothetical protein